ncbi:MAG: glycoside hydrolase family 43 protein [Lachnospiraceae bacterium]
MIQNPIISGFHPDPSICRVGDEYYIANSSFEFLPGVPLFKSNNLKDWKKIGHCIDRAEQMEFTDCQHNAGIFAPTLRYHNSRFYMITTNVCHEGAFAPGGSGNFIMTADSIEGPWSLPMWVSQGGIDPSLFWDDDGTCYLQSTMMAPDSIGSLKNAIFQAIIDPDTGVLLSESKIISFGGGGRFPEGPHIYKKDGFYYLLLAEGGTEFGHMVTIFRSKDIWGPYEACPKNPILTASQENDPYIAGIGHADLIEDGKGNWWMVFLGYRMSENYYHHMGRETAIAPVEWIDGWPLVNHGEVPGRFVDSRGQEQTEEVLKKEFTEFNNQKLDLEWNFFRTFFDGYSFTSRPGYFALFANGKTLNDKATPAFIGRRIDHFEFQSETLIEYSGSEGTEAGLAIAHTPFAHMEFVISYQNGKKIPLLRKRLFDMVTEEKGSELQEGNAYRLKIIGDRYTFQFILCDEEGNDLQCVGEGAVKLLSSEVVGGCIGTYIGLYASGNGKKSAEPAYYKWFSYEWLPEKPKKAMFFSD